MEVDRVYLIRKHKASAEIRRARATPDCKFQKETGKSDHVCLPLSLRPKLFRQSKKLLEGWL
jgi:hypothetical protein